MTGGLGTRTFTTQEVADLFRVDQTTVRRWVARGQLEATRTPGGRALRFSAATIVATLGSDYAAEVEAVLAARDDSPGQAAAVTPAAGSPHDRVPV